ncbi:MAG: hypothetical protein C0456_14710 [Hyphomonas sp.]|nr:hypothetical protein [Hyphomonas sp.]
MRIGCKAAIAATLLSTFLAWQSGHTQTEALGYFPDRASLHRDLWQSYAYVTSGEVNPNVIDWTVQFASAYGREDLIVSIVERYISRPCVSEEPFDPEKIREAIKAHQVVVISETHHSADDRQRILDMARIFADEGFTYYAAETFQDEVFTAGIKTGINAGFYSSEPFYGRLLRELAHLEFKFVPFEARLSGQVEGDRRILREQVQAANIIDRVLKENPDARILVHVGWAHAFESPEDEYGMAWMARRLKEMSGIDPLTISQTFCRANGDEAVLIRGADEGGKDELSHTDLAIGIPSWSFLDGRPSWHRNLGFHPVPVPAALRDETLPVIVEAMPEGSDELAVPEDRLLIAPEETHVLMLPDGTYDLFSFTQAGQMRGPVRIEVTSLAE